MLMKVEGAGKKRLFPIDSPLYQASVRPIHDWAMTVLARLKMDGLFGNPFATSWTFILCSVVTMTRVNEKSVENSVLICVVEKYVC
ncbi:hypothetical protein ACFX11_038247 [Malus domestica]